jgi:hypothetical protein
MARAWSRLIAACAWMLLGIVAGPVAHAGDARCSDCGQPCREYDLTCCTVMVPAKVVETRMESRVVKAMEDREETYTVFVKKPVTRKYVKEYCYLANDVKTTTVVEKECHVVTVPVERTYSVKVPTREIREIPVCKPGCAHCAEKGTKPETQTCEVIVEKTEMRQETCEEPRLVIEKKSHDITYCVMVPKKETQVCAEEVTYELVPVEQKRIVQVCVPRVEKYPVDHVVCKMVPQERECCKSCAAKHGK